MTMVSAEQNQLAFCAIFLMASLDLLVVLSVDSDNKREFAKEFEKTNPVVLI